VQRVAPYRTYVWGAQDRLVRVEKDDRTGAGGDLKVEYKYCQTCGGAMSERIEYASDMQTVVSWLRYEYDGLNLLRIDERYDGEAPAGLDENDPWRPLNVFIHGPGAIGQIVKGKWYNYYSDGQNPTSCCDSGEYYYFYDALGNVNGVLDEGGHYYRWEMDAFGNDLPGGNAFLAMDQPGAKEHLTGKMFDTATGLYYFAARWYDPQVGRYISCSRYWPYFETPYVLCENDPVNTFDNSGKLSLKTIIMALKKVARKIDDAIAALIRKKGTCVGNASRHVNFRKQVCAMKDASLRKCNRNLNRRIDEHIKLLENAPQSPAANHWLAELKTFTEQKAIVEAEIAARKAGKVGALCCLPACVEEGENNCNLAELAEPPPDPDEGWIVFILDILFECDTEAW